MKFENTTVFNFDGAIRGMRNPMNSWDKSDSEICQACSREMCPCGDCKNPYDGVLLGENDLELMQKLIKAGSEHRKFMRQVFVSVDITAPLYWWKEFDTYKVGTVSNSCSTMHKLAETPITIDCFEMGGFGDFNGRCSESAIKELWRKNIQYLEFLRKQYLETKDICYWKELIRLLPESWLQKRTITMNYENLLNMCSKEQRRFHKLTEWSVDFINWARSLPYAQELIFLDELEESK